MPVLEIKNLHKTFDQNEILKGIDLTVDKGEVVSIIGPSGSGKSTLLRCATLLETMTKGSMKYSDTQVVTEGADGFSVYLPPKELTHVKAMFGLVFQNFNLFPHYSVLKNIIDAPISVQKRNKDEVIAEARQLLAKMGLADRENFYPFQLSGGQQQRVSIARALINTAKLSSSVITGDVKAAINAGATGSILFRWGLSEFVNFKSLGSTSAALTTGSVSIANILTAASALKSTIESKKSIPSTVSVGGVSYSTAEFLYMMAKATVLINSGKTSTQVLPVSASAPSNSNGDATGKLYTSDYVDVASRLVSFIPSNGQAPNYATSTLGNIKYEELVDSFARILAYYKSNSQLPNYVEIKQFSSSSSSSSSSTSTSTSSATTKTISIKNVLTGATNLKTYYSTNGKLPNTVTAGGITFTLPEFLYVMSQAIYQIGNSNSKDITYISGVSAPESPFGDTISSQQLTKDNYLTVANNVAKFISTNKLAPNYASSAVGKIIYSELVDAFSRVLAYYNTNGELPNYVVISYGSSSSSSTTTATGSGLNQANTASDVSAYLKSSTNCQVGNSAIKSTVNSVTSGLTTTYQKAVAIYNYVRDKVSYSFYYNTKYGAVGTLSAKTGNCVDQAHLLVAMARTAGIAARYVHGTCRFSDGTYGHVWVQILVDGKWYVADPTSTRNSFGNVANWNTNTYSLNGIYSSISF